MNLLAVWLSISSILSIALGTFCYLKNRFSLVNGLWFLCCLSVAVFCFGLSRFIISTVKSEAVVWIQVLHIGAIFVPVFFLHFVLSFLKISNRKLVIFSYSICFFLVGLSFSPLFIKDIVPKLNFPYWSKVGPLYILFLLFLLGEVFFAEYLLFKFHQQASSFCRNQIKYLILGSMIGFGAGATNFFLAFDIPIFPFGNYILILYLVIITYAIARYRLMEIDLVFNRAIFVLFVGFLIFIYMIIIRAIHSFLGFGISIAGAIMSIVLILSLAPSRERLTYLLDKIFYRGRFDYQDLLQQANQRLTTILDLNELLNYILRILVENINTKRVAIFLLEEEKCLYRIRVCVGIEEELSNKFFLKTQDKIILWLNKNKSAFIKEEGQFIFSSEVFWDIYNDLGKIGAEVIIPLFYKEDLIGILTLDYKQTGAIYNQRDIAILTNLANQASYAIMNAQLYLGAITDGLTRLYHRRYLERRLNEEIDRARIFKCPLSFLIIDVDHFKELNDIYGHNIGDLVLKDIAGVLKVSMRATDIPCRYGGEEFTVIVTETDLEGAKVVAERLRREIEKHTFKYTDLTLALTISIGISSYQEGMDKNRLIELADSGLYRAKEEGRNRVCVGS